MHFISNQSNFNIGDANFELSNDAGNLYQIKNALGILPGLNHE